jgi:hypothetical protein
VFPELFIIDEDDVGYTWHLLQRLSMCGLRQLRLVYYKEVFLPRYECCGFFEAARVPPHVALGTLFFVNVRFKWLDEYCRPEVKFKLPTGETVKSIYAGFDEYIYEHSDAKEAELVFVSNFDDGSVAAVDEYKRDPNLYMKTINAKEIVVSVLLGCDAENVHVTTLAYF